MEQTRSLIRRLFFSEQKRFLLPPIRSIFGHSAQRLWRSIFTARKLFLTDSLFRNAVFLMASTAIMAVLGFGFWMFVAHLYSPTQIGLASALISISLLLSNLSLLGLNSGIIRFLPESRTKSRDINAAIATVGVATAVAATVYLLIGDHFGSNLPFFVSGLVGNVLFVVFMATVSLNILTDSIFIANRRAGYHTLIYTIFGTIRLLLPILLISLGSLGIFLAYIFAVMISLLLSLFFMWRACGYRPFSTPNWRFIMESRKYFRNNYVGVILSGLPSQIMPIFIISRLGAAEAAYFSMAWTMVNLLYVIPSSTTQSLLAENSQRGAERSHNVLHATKILAVILIPAVTLSILVAPHLLSFFGDQYADGSSGIFQILAFSTFFVAANLIGNTILNVQHRTSGIVVAQLAMVVVTLGSVVFLIRYGLIGVGISMLLGYMATNIVHAAIYLWARRQLAQSRQRESRKFSPNYSTVKLLLDSYGIVDFEYVDVSHVSVNRTIIVTTPRSKKYVLKIYPPVEKSELIIQEEANFTRFLAQNQIPVPTFLKNHKGEVVSSKVINGVHWSYTLMNFESGIHPISYSHQLIQHMAMVQGKIHAYGAEYLDGPTARERLLKQMLAPRKRRPYGYFLSSAKGVSHFDYDGSNILVNGNKVSCVLDFESMRYDLLVVCVYFTLSRLYEAVKDESKLELYLQSYQGVRPLSLVERLTIRVALAVRYRSPKLVGLQF